MLHEPDLQDGRSEVSANAEKQFTIMMLSFQAELQKHTQLLLQTRKTTPKTHIHSEPTAEQNQGGYEYCIALEHEKPIKATCSLLSMECDHVSVLISNPPAVKLGGGGLSVYQPDVFVTVFPFMSCSDQ